MSFVCAEFHFWSSQWTLHVYNPQIIIMEDRNHLKNILITLVSQLMLLLSCILGLARSLVHIWCFFYCLSLAWTVLRFLFCCPTISHNSTTLPAHGIR